MAMVAFYAGLIIGILVGACILSLFSFFLAQGNEGVPGSPERCPQEKPMEL
jgi:hypothetical protein